MPRSRRPAEELRRAGDRLLLVHEHAVHVHQPGADLAMGHPGCSVRVIGRARRVVPDGEDRRAGADGARASRPLPAGGRRPGGRADPRHHVERRHLGARDAAAAGDRTRDRARPARPRRLRQAARRLLARRVRERRARPARGARPRSRDRRRPLARRRDRDAVRLPVPRAHRAARARVHAAGSGARSTCCCAPRRCRAPSTSLPLPRPRAGSARRRAASAGRARGSACSAGRDLGEMVQGFLSLSDGESRARRSSTRLRAVIDPGGQRVSAHDRLYLAASLRR